MARECFTNQTGVERRGGNVNSPGAPWLLWGLLCTHTTVISVTTAQESSTWHCRSPHLRLNGTTLYAASLTLTQLFAPKPAITPFFFFFFFCCATFVYNGIHLNYLKKFNFSVENSAFLSRNKTSRASLGGVRHTELRTRYRRFTYEKVSFRLGVIEISWSPGPPILTRRAVATSKTICRLPGE